MAVSAKDVMTLRNRTGLGMMECKGALAETDGDMEKAIALLRERLGKKMEERSGREAAEGAIAIGRGNGSITLVELKSETDFSANTVQFVEAAQQIADLALKQPDGEIAPTDEMLKLVDNLRITIKENISFSRGVKKSGPKVGGYVHHNRKIGAIVTGEGELSPELLTGICQHIAAAVPPLTPAPLAIDETGLPQAQVEAQKAVFIEESQSSGKPANIIEKMAIGKLRKWMDDHTLLGQLYIRELDAKKPVRDFIPKGAKLTSFARFELGN